MLTRAGVSSTCWVIEKERVREECVKMEAIESERKGEREKERQRDRNSEIKTNNMKNILKWDLEKNGRQWRAMVFT